ncbi:ATP-binding cassette domain-containing protein [Fusobacterium nucleatum]|uniref:ABC transporter ATP-binding protein n=1 Tax=Fusobacterium nucleatum TaxID=851 RepID=UPI0030D4DEEF
MSVQEVNNEYVILTENLCKDYTYYKKEVGLKGSLKNLFHREKLIKKAVQDLSIKIPKGAIVGLIGLNGAGKTTTLKMLTGIIMPTSGKVDVLGYFPFNKKKEYLRRIAMVMGNKSQLWWDLPALDTFELNKIIYEIDDSEYKNTLNSMVEIMGVEKQLNVQVRRLSLGERMKMELIASLIHKPDIVFLDEPTIGLDVITQYNIRNFLKEYCVKYGSTILLTSHNFNDIVTLCDSIILINNGEMIYSDTFKNFQKQFFNQKYFVLKLKEPNVDEFISKLHLENDIKIEKIDSNSIKIATDNNKSLDILKNISGNFIQELSDINIENISMDDVIRKIYQK